MSLSSVLEVESELQMSPSVAFGVKVYEALAVLAKCQAGVETQLAKLLKMEHQWEVSDKDFVLQVGETFPLVEGALLVTLENDARFVFACERLRKAQKEKDAMPEDARIEH